MTDAGDTDTRPPERIALGSLELTRWQAGDLADLQAAVSASISELEGWLAWASEDRTAQRGFLETTSRCWEAGERFEYAIRVGTGVAGGVGLMRRIGPGGLEIGYWVHSAHTGRGLAKLASAALTQAAFELPGVDHVEIHHDEANLASRAVPAGLGFELVERADKTPAAPLETGTDLIWRLDRDRFPASAARALLRRSGQGARD